MSKTLHLLFALAVIAIAAQSPVEAGKEIGECMEKHQIAKEGLKEKIQEAVKKHFTTGGPPDPKAIADCEKEVDELFKNENLESKFTEFKNCMHSKFPTK